MAQSARGAGPRDGPRAAASPTEARAAAVPLQGPKTFTFHSFGRALPFREPSRGSGEEGGGAIISVSSVPPPGRVESHREAGRGGTRGEAGRGARPGEAQLHFETPPSSAASRRPPSVLRASATSRRTGRKPRVPLMRLHSGGAQGHRATPGPEDGGPARRAVSSCKSFLLAFPIIVIRPRARDEEKKIAALLMVHTRHAMHYGGTARHSARSPTISARSRPACAHTHTHSRRTLSIFIMTLRWPCV